MVFIQCVIKFNTRAEILTKKLALGLHRVYFVNQDAAPENSRVELLFLACWDNLGIVQLHTKGSSLTTQNCSTNTSKILIKSFY